VLAAGWGLVRRRQRGEARAGRRFIKQSDEGNDDGTECANDRADDGMTDRGVNDGSDRTADAARARPSKQRRRGGGGLGGGGHEGTDASGNGGGARTCNRTTDTKPSTKGRKKAAGGSRSGRAKSRGHTKASQRERVRSSSREAREDEMDNEGAEDEPWEGPQGDEASAAEDESGVEDVEANVDIGSSDDARHARLTLAAQEPLNMFYQGETRGVARAEGAGDRHADVVGPAPGALRGVALSMDD
jgi:hypothetical protein